MDLSPFAMMLSQSAMEREMGGLALDAPATPEDPRPVRVRRRLADVLFRSAHAIAPPGHRDPVHVA